MHDMAKTKQEGHRTENTSDDQTDHETSKHDKPIIDEGSCDHLFGIDPQGSIIHKEAHADVKTNLINTKFYFDSAAASIDRILNAMDRVQRYDKEQKANDESRTDASSDRSA